MPCLNEKETIGACVERARSVIDQHRWTGEVVVSDNGSNDGSPDIATSLGARVVFQPARGYGNAYLKGLSAARGKYVVIADSDNTYDLLESAEMVRLLQSGEADFVMGSRFKGKMEKDAMPWLHRYIGNPGLTWMFNRLYGTHLSDTHCGMRAFTKEALGKMRLSAPGMEFAQELIIQGARNNLRFREVPISYRPRKSRSKLRSFRDGWRHLRYMINTRMERPSKPAAR